MWILHSESICIDGKVALYHFFPVNQCSNITTVYSLLLLSDVTILDLRTVFYLLHVIYFFKPFFSGSFVNSCCTKVCHTSKLSLNIYFWGENVMFGWVINALAAKQRHIFSLLYSIYSSCYTVYSTQISQKIFKMYLFIFHPELCCF